MARGKKTGGRVRGTPNRRTAVCVAEVEAFAASDTGESPKDYMLRVMRDPTADHARRDAMAKAAAPSSVMKSRRFTRSPRWRGRAASVAHPSHEARVMKHGCIVNV
jgi:hypothetical protein